MQTIEPIREREPTPHMRHVITTGETWLRGYADAYYHRPKMVPQGRRNAEAYGKGYYAGLLALRAR